jgi:hypothetical protein
VPRGDDDLRSKDEIRDVVLRLARGIDRCDLELLRSCYHPDAHEEHGWFSGSAWEYAGRLVERRDGVWLIARRLVVLDWSSADADGTRDHLFAPGRRDRTDPSYDRS